MINEYDIFGNKKQTFWKFSSKNLLKSHNCNIQICHGKCCKGPIFWPGRASLNNQCVNLTKQGCSLSPTERPITCLLYPLMINKNNTVIKHFRCVAFCKDNIKNGDPLIVSLFWCFESFFGKEKALYLQQEILKGKDVILSIPEEIVDCINEEKRLSSLNLPPVARKEKI